MKDFQDIKETEENRDYREAITSINKYTYQLLCDIKENHGKNDLEEAISLMLLDE